MDVTAQPNDSRDLRYRTPHDGTVGRSAQRMRKCREDRKAGFTRIPFLLGPAGRDLLVKLGWLADADRQNQSAIHEAFAQFVNQAASLGITPDPEELASQPPAPMPARPQDRELWLQEARARLRV